MGRWFWFDDKPQAEVSEERIWRVTAVPREKGREKQHN